MTNIFSLLPINRNNKKPHFINNGTLNWQKQKIVWYEIKNAIDPITNQNYGDCYYKIFYINNNYYCSCLIDKNDCLIADPKTADRFYKLLVNFLDDQKFNSIFNLA